ncbi:helix-turn-helix domain-containing protein [Paenibacillus thalictri]|uniref:DNA-binding protein n=1 Tax=Paenibacillus thalictri TaxID=2527873 RepID=A0A4Q9DWZ3_9BACL|nr:helix-turn-helix domain-containing protein [Paenibacillus thalictri]TBL80875.1 DNA-binding protein [Paenibacillus thalictri]
MYDDYNEILTVSQLAELLQIGLNTAYYLVNSGEIESFKVKNSYRVQRSAITDYIISRSKRKLGED